MKQNPIVKKIGINRIVLCCVLVLMYVIFSIFGKNFVGMQRIMSALNYAYFLGFLSLGVTFVIATGGIDFSIGPVMFCSALVSGYCQYSCGAFIWCFQWLFCGLLDGAAVYHFHGKHEHCQRSCFGIYQDPVRKLAPVGGCKRLVQEFHQGG